MSVRVSSSDRSGLSRRWINSSRSICENGFKVAVNGSSVVRAAVQLLLGSRAARPAACQTSTAPIQQGDSWVAVGL